MNKIIVSGLLVLAAASSASWSGVAAAEAGKSLTLAVNIDLNTWDPFYDVNNDDLKAIVFEAPLRIVGQTVKPWLAERWTVSPDGSEYTLYFRKGVKFHNGRELKADDVLWSIERARDQKIGHHLGDRFVNAKGAVKIDDYTVKVIYDGPTNLALDGLARLFIYPKESLATINNHPVGTGPFQIAENEEGDHVTFTRFADYWQPGKPKLQSLVVKPILDDQARLLNLKSGSADVIVGVSYADIAALQQEPELATAHNELGSSYSALTVNLKHPPFDAQPVRQALNYAIDRQAINQLAFHGQGNLTSLPVTAASWAYPADLANHYGYDPQKAKALLATSKLDPNHEYNILVQNVSGLLDVAQVIQQQLAQVGIKSRLNPLDNATFFPTLFKGDFDLVVHGTGDANVDPANYFVGASVARPFRNFYGVEGDWPWFPGYKATIEKAGKATDQAQRKALYHELYGTLVDQGWTIPLAWSPLQVAYNKRVQGLNFANILGTFYWENVSVQ